MLVSGHTVSVWTDWDNVPKYIAEAFRELEKLPGDLIAFVPKVIANGLAAETLLKAIHIVKSADFDTGTACVGRLANGS